MIRNLLFSALFLGMTAPAARAQRVSTFTVSLSKASNGLDIPVSFDLDPTYPIPDSTYTLFEWRKGKRVAIPFQLEQQAGHFRMDWIIHPGDSLHSLSPDAAREFVYELTKNSSGRLSTPASPPRFSQIVAHANDSALTIENGNQHLLRYWFATVDPPAGVDSHFRRSGFIHPLWTPHGQELTRIQPPDHHHHYGLWNPWTHVLFEKDTVDFWNLGDKKGTVRFAKFVSLTSGPVYAEFQALHQHVVLKKDGSEKVALNEIQTVRVYRPEKNSDYYLLDITSQLQCATESPVLLLAYRYGGLGWRATPIWNKDNSEVLTSEGKDRKTADGSKARWCIVEGSLDSLGVGRYGDYGGAVMLSYPANYNHPEPLRIWPENSNGRGDMFANFDPTKDRDWLLDPGKTYTLKYRLVVFNGKFNKEKAESAWQYFAEPPEIKSKTSKFLSR